MGFLRNIVVALLLLSATGLASPVGAGTGRELAQPFRWRSGPIKIYVSTSLSKYNSSIKADSDVLGAVRASLKAWSDAADVVFELESSDRQSISPTGPAGDGFSLITIASTPENVLLFTRDSQKSAALTRTFRNRKGVITEADIVLNPFEQFSTDGSFGTFDLQSVLTHEIGHLLGLRHSQVLGSVMCDNLPKNGTAETAGAIPRDLSDSDVAAIRDLYGTADLIDDCCSIITGKLTVGEGMIGKGLRVWAEDSSGGRVVAQSEVAPDGEFRMGGIPAGTYRVFVRSREGATDEISSVDLRPVDQKVLNRTISFADRKFSLEMVGLDGRLTESAATVAKGAEHVVFVGGKGVDAKHIVLTTNSPYFHIDSSTVARQDVKADTSVVSFNLKVDADAPAGVYSLFASLGTGERSVLIGAIRVH